MQALPAVRRKGARWIAPPTAMLAAGAMLFQVCSAFPAATKGSGSPTAGRVVLAGARSASTYPAYMAVVAVPDAQNVATATGVTAVVTPEPQPAERPSDYLEWWVETPEVADPRSPTGVALGQVGFVQSAGRPPEAFCTVYDGNLDAPDLEAIYSCPLHPLASGYTTQFFIYWAPTSTDRLRWAFREGRTILGTFDLCGKYWPVVKGSGWTDPEFWSEYDWSGAPTAGLAAVTANRAIQLLQGTAWVTPGSADAVGGSTYPAEVWHIAGTHEDSVIAVGAVRIGEKVKAAASGERLWP